MIAAQGFLTRLRDVTEGAVVAGCLIFWSTWQLAAFAYWILSQDGCTKSGCGGPDYVAMLARDHAIMTAGSLLLLSPLILRACGRVIRNQSKSRSSTMALTLSVSALAATWLVAIDMAFGCCSYWTNFLPAWLSVPLFGLAPVLGIVAAIALAATYKTPRIDHIDSAQPPTS